MKTKVILAMIGIIAITGSIGSVLAFENYNPVKFASTEGYDPAFLQDQEVKQTCWQSHKDLMSVGLKDLGYCSKALGTLP